MGKWIRLPQEQWPLRCDMGGLRWCANRPRSRPDATKKKQRACQNSWACAFECRLRTLRPQRANADAGILQVPPKRLGERPKNFGCFAAEDFAGPDDPPVASMTSQVECLAHQLLNSLATSYPGSA